MQEKTWENDFPPFNIFGNLYFLGNEPASTHIIDTGSGLIMLDSGYKRSLDVLLEKMFSLGLDPKNIKCIFHTHGHIDHIEATRELVKISGAKTFIGEPDRQYANGGLDLSFAKELGMTFTDTFEPDVLLHDGDEITFGNTTIKCVATPGHTPGAMSFFFNVIRGKETFRAGLHGGMGINTLSKDFLTKYNLPFSLREDFCKSMLRLNKEKVDIFLGNHMQHNKTAEKYKRLQNGEEKAFINPSEWQPFNLWCIENLKNMEEKERQTK